MINTDISDNQIKNLDKTIFDLIENFGHSYDFGFFKQEQRVWNDRMYKTYKLKVTKKDGTAWDENDLATISPNNRAFYPLIYNINHESSIYEIVFIHENILTRLGSNADKAYNIINENARMIDSKSYCDAKKLFNISEIISAYRYSDLFMIDRSIFSFLKNALSDNLSTWNKILEDQTLDKSIAESIRFDFEGLFHLVNYD
ncbi:hypothetical protein [Marinilactibacillus kalidii]|uniref:hypothetical protein n=1 Tax=Marinilactibacillus kalidii TaxID=2820274 RepID=UPI001ABDC097|nr:hypothetical protein [Marinilactibacillus kalidii]